MELKFSNVGKETFHPWKFIFPPLEILFSSGGTFRGKGIRKRIAGKQMEMRGICTISLWFALRGKVQKAWICAEVPLPNR